MKCSISHDRSEETLEAKARWFQSLSVEERMAIADEIADLALTLHPDMADKKHVRSLTGRVQILERP
jgi:hypothetical protein